MEEYEKRFNGSTADLALRRIYRKLRGTNDARGLAYQEAATKEIMQHLRQDLRNIARNYYRSVSDTELLCRKYRQLGACDEEFVKWIQDVYSKVLVSLGQPEAACEPREAWEVKLSDE